MYVTYSLTTGEIHSVIECQPEHAIQGDNVICVDYCIPSMQYVQNGELQQYTETQMQLKRQKPSHWHEWDNTTMTWVDKTPEALK